MNGAQGLYYAWHGITRFDKGVASINLFFNRATAWMDVHSYLPYEGKVVLRNKQAHTALVRIPGWVDKNKVKASIERPGPEGKSETTQITPPRFGSRLVIQDLKPADKIIVEFPVPIWVDEYTINGKKFTITFKGSTVIDVGPRDEGNHYQIYLRNCYRANKAPTKTVKQFIPDKIIPLGTY